MTVDGGVDVSEVDRGCWIGEGGQGDELCRGRKVLEGGVVNGKEVVQESGCETIFRSCSEGQLTNTLGAAAKGWIGGVGKIGEVAAASKDVVSKYVPGSGGGVGCDIDAGSFSEITDKFQFVHEEVEVRHVGSCVPPHWNTVGLLHDGVGGGLDVGVCEDEAEKLFGGVEVD